MGFFLDKLPPAPFVADKDGMVIAGHGQDSIDVADCYMDEDLAEMFAAARNALAAQMEYGWTSERIFDGCWKGSWKVVVPDGITDFEEWNAWIVYSQNRFPDPVTALAEAYRWKKMREKESITIPT